jgi:nicotinate-nucleotide adenylyltransferase
MASTRRLGIFGGSFNPPHLAHLAVAESAGHQLGLDRVLWIPAATAPHKQGRTDAASAQDRLHLTRLATAGNPRFAVSDVELARGGVSYTADTLRALAAEHPEKRFVLIMGGDSLAYFPRWREPTAIAALADLAVYARPGSDLEPALGAARTLGATVHVIDAPRLDLSSTELRRRIAAGKSTRYLLPEAVRAAITGRGLYGVG